MLIGLPGFLTSLPAALLARLLPLAWLLPLARLLAPGLRGLLLRILPTRLFLARLLAARFPALFAGLAALALRIVARGLLRALASFAGTLSLPLAFAFAPSLLARLGLPVALTLAALPCLPVF